MIKRFEFTRPRRGSWFLYEDYASICTDTLRRWVGGIGREKTIYLCFSDRPHPEAYAYKYSFDIEHRLRIHTQTEGNPAPFLDDVDALFSRAAMKGEIPRKGWGWIEIGA